MFPLPGPTRRFNRELPAWSGNVRQKLAAATQADYVAALRAVMPPDRTAEEINARPGAPWIPAELVAQFAQETFHTSGVTVEHVGGRWVVEIPAYKRYGAVHAETRAALWAGGLKKRRRKEARFAADINRQISKRIVGEAQRTGAVSPSNS